jgi:SAM-dependent methyltransferase
VNRDALFAQMDDWYAPKLAEHGATAAGVDWNSEASQALRFRQLLRIAEGVPRCSINDFGCGYGALAAHLEGTDVDYTGFDVSPRMVALAREQHPERRFTDRLEDLGPADFTVASGVFNLRFDVPDDAWTAYVHETIATIAARSRRGFAFNMLTSWSDPDRMRPDLFYGDPTAFFAHCKRHHAPDVALLHDYGLFEWTILVRRRA